MAEGTEVVPEAVRAFSRAAFDQRERFADGLSALGPIGGANIGGSGMQEATVASARYAELVQSALQVTQDTINGLTALHYSAATVAQNYETGDSSQQAQMASVEGSFSPPPGTPTIASVAAEQAAAARQEQARLSLLARRMGEDPTPQPTWANGIPIPGATTTSTSEDGERPFTQALDEVQAHREELARIENPEDPADVNEIEALQHASYSVEEDIADAEQLEEAMEQAYGLEYEVVVEHGVPEVVLAEGQGPAPQS